MATKAAPKPSTPRPQNSAAQREKAQDAALRYWALVEADRQNAEEKRALKAELEAYATANPGAFEGKKSLHLVDGVTLVWASKAEVVLPDGFDAARFLGRYPDAAKVSISVSKLKGLYVSGDERKRIESWFPGLDIKEQDAFEVKCGK